MSNIVIDAIKTRRSIRKYTDEQVSESDLKEILDAGTYAPTGHNFQDPIIIAVRNQQVIEKLVKMNAAILGTDGNPYYGAKTIILVFVPFPEKNGNAIQDGSLVLGNMMLAAHSLGLVSCWINREREMFSTLEGAELMKEFGIPDGYMGLGALSVGHPTRPTPSPLPRKENYYKIIE